MTTYLVDSNDFSVKEELLKRLIRRYPGRWLILSSSIEIESHQVDCITGKDLKAIELSYYRHVWIEHWPTMAENDEFLYALFSRSIGLTLLSKSHEYPFMKKFVDRWQKEGVTFSFVLRDQVYPCTFVRSRKVLKEYSFACEERSACFFFQNDLHQKPWLFDLCSGQKEAYFFHSQASPWNLAGLWLLGRQRKREVISFAHANKSGRDTYQKNALSRSTLDWGLITSQWQKSCHYFLRWTRWWQEAKEYRFRTRSSY